MNLNKIKLELKKDLAKDMSKLVYSLENTLKTDSIIFNDFIIYQSQLQQTISDFNRSIISKKERDLVLDKLRGSLITLVDSIALGDIVEEGNKTNYKEKKACRKVYYAKIIHLSKRVIYNRFVGRLNRSIGVKDEYYLFAYDVQKTSSAATNKTEVWGTGIVDIDFLDPWQSQDKDVDLEGPIVDGFIQRYKLNREKSESIDCFKYYNCLQEDIETIGMANISKDSDTRLIVDFSSVPGIGDILLEKPIASLIQGNTILENLSVFELELFCYHAHVKALQPGQKIQMKFSLDYER